MPKEQIWKDTFAIDCYVLAYNGATNIEIAHTLGVKPDTFAKWLQTKHTLRYAIDLASAKRRDKPESFLEYVHGRLSPEMKKLWDEISYYAEHDNAVVQIEALLGPLSERVRQHLWLHAMIETNFDAGLACRMVNVSKQRVDKWAREDTTFVQLLDEVKWHKANYFENALMDLVSIRNFPAVIHANKTFNRDRGYGEKIDVAHTHDHQHTHSVRLVDITKLNLDLETRLKILEAVKELRAREQEEEDARPPIPVKALPV